MLSDIEIAQQAKLLPIKEVASQINISEDELEFYGKYKAKLSDELAHRVKDNSDGKLILTTEDSGEVSLEFNVDELTRKSLVISMSGSDAKISYHFKK